MPAFPFFAAVIAALIGNLNRNWLLKISRSIVAVFIAVWTCGVLLLALGLGQLTSETGGLLCLCAFVAVLALCYWLAFHWMSDSAPLALASAPLIVLASIAPLLLTMALPHPLQNAAAERCGRPKCERCWPTLYVGTPLDASALRLYSPGLRESRNLPGESLAQFEHVVTGEPRIAKEPQRRGFDVAVEHGGWQGRAGAAVFGAILSGEFRQTVRDKSDPIFVARRPNAPSPPGAARTLSP